MSERTTWGDYWEVPEGLHGDPEPLNIWLSQRLQDLLDSAHRAGYVADGVIRLTLHEHLWSTSRMLVGTVKVRPKDSPATVPGPTQGDTP